MTKLTAGSVFTLTPRDGGSVKISTNGGIATIVETPTVGVVKTTNIGPMPVRMGVGPYEEGATVVISSQSANMDIDMPGGIIGSMATGSDRTIAADDDGVQFNLTAAATFTIPASLSPRPSLVVVPPPSGNASIAVSGGAQLNGATSTLTRARSANLAGFVVNAYQDADGYGVSGA